VNVPRISYVESLAGVLVGWYSDHSGLMLCSVRGRPGLPMLRGGLPMLPTALRRVGLQARPHGADLAAVARLGVDVCTDGINLKGRTVASRCQCELEAYRPGPRSGGEGRAEVGPAPAASGPPDAVDCLNDRHAVG
jgi:hypothetical protein